MKRILSLSLLGATMLMSSWCYSSSQDAEGAEQLFSIASKRSLPSEATKGYLQNLVEAPPAKTSCWSM
ncbi:hypothetical protein [Pseudomonas sp. Teo4]|uniref:hypothetical protein n=1 Tax=Pseudomonas sp. Teo4 TaxID=3064528 RepID=UPI002AB9AA4F|nr:hypothetical protein [Pseudomonas sp. Teo4]MDZ3994902.1 hypothetical protein [Pseudomonas sp. Teo4]